jgi:hypothetical protein
LRHFGRTKYDVPVTRKPQVVDPESKLALLKKVAVACKTLDLGVANGPSLQIAHASNDVQDFTLSATRSTRHSLNRRSLELDTWL